MVHARCDGCGRPVRTAGGRENVWTFEGDRGGGLTVVFDDAEFDLCASCLERLPEEPTAADVAALEGGDPA